MCGDEMRKVIRVLNLTTAGFCAAAAFVAIGVGDVEMSLALTILTGLNLYLGVTSE